MRALLAAAGVVVDHPGSPRVLDGLDLTLIAGRRLALLGANGAGKSTLLRCLSGALRPSSGAVLVDGEPLRHDRRGLARHRQTVQLVLQDPDDQIVASEVRHDVAYGPTNLGLDAAEVATRVDHALDALGIADLARRPVHHLSFGQRKRVALAGAVAMAPRVLLLDEPTAGLDPAGTVALLETIEVLEARGVTVALSTHDLDLAWRWADEVAVLVGGRAVVGDPGVLLADDDLLRQAALASPWQARVLRAAGAAIPTPRPRDAEDVVAALGIRESAIG
ncbi:ATP-binding cassette domain-containing protein [Nocardioides fonticola]|uniref:ABC transporter ATP-binding protein n=1 Tax=Nocardioides fonticola TaxID=450363 RepID=A0ABP7XW65_9ACTN